MQTMTKKRKNRFKVFIFVAASVVLIAVVSGITVYSMMHSRPGGYVAAQPKADGKVSTYLTNDLGPQFFNKIQLDKPFEIVVEQEGLNEILRDNQTLSEMFGFSWPIVSDAATIGIPQVSFEEGLLAVICPVTLGADFIATLEAGPEVNEAGDLVLNIDKIKAGSLNITPLAKKLAMQAAEQSGVMAPADPSDSAAVRREMKMMRDIVLAAVENKPLVPVFPAGKDRRIRLEHVTIEERVMKLGFVPVR